MLGVDEVPMRKVIRLMLPQDGGAIVYAILKHRPTGLNTIYTRDLTLVDTLPLLEFKLGVTVNGLKECDVSLATLENIKRCHVGSGSTNPSTKRNTMVFKPTVDVTTSGANVDAWVVDGSDDIHA